MNAQWVDEYVDMLLAPETTAPLPGSTPAATASALAARDPAIGHRTTEPATAEGRGDTPDPLSAAVRPRVLTRPVPSPAPAAVPARSEHLAHSSNVDPSPPSLHDERELRAGARADPADSGGTRWLRVCVGGDSYALELLRVQEVLRPVPIVAMRGTPAWTLGVMNLRGRIVPVIDLGAWLGGRPATAGETTRIVVVERDDELIGILVSMVEDVVTLQRERRRATPSGQGGPTLIEDVGLLTPLRNESTHANAARGATVGVARVGSVPTVLLDASRLFE